MASPVLQVGALAVVVAALGGWGLPSTVPGPPLLGASADGANMAAGPTATLEVAGAFAVSPTGSLYVVDEARHEVLVRLGDGQFRAVAGDGRDGFAGDGGLATRAALSDISDIAFAPDGDLYIADGARVRAVGQDRMIRAVAGDGATPASESAGGP
ncbi:MAG: serine/threonine protein kinase, partial [Acidimicrobiales bacterium]